MVCPICKKPVSERDDPKSPNRFYPFCSERCKVIDLGRWLGGRYQIPVKPDDENADSDGVSDGEDR